MGYIERNFKDNLADGSQPNGWFDGGSKPMDSSLRIGPDGAHAHNLMVKEIQYSKNMAYVESMVKELRKRNIYAVLLQLPFHPNYSKYVDRQKFENMDKAIRNFAIKMDLGYINYTDDPRFIVDDYTDMPDHLNVIGAKKLSMVINEDIVKPAFAPEIAARIAKRAAHNLQLELPEDFDPEQYLKLNPGLEEYWKSTGINETGQALLDHAEVHYLHFGRKDNWKF